MTAGTDGVSREMPRYKSHKIVHALKIKAAFNRAENDGISISFAEDGFAPIELDRDITNRFHFHDAEGKQDLGYYVVYKDGYVSWSPTKEFEDGYTLDVGS